MSTTTQDTIAYTFTATVTMPIPRTITADTDPQTVDHALRCYYIRARDEMQHSGGAFPFATLQLFAAAMQEGGAVTILYTNEKGEASARTLFPSSIRLTGERKVEVRAYCTKRCTTRSFRMDRMADAHLVTMPGECAA